MPMTPILDMEQPASTSKWVARTTFLATTAALGSFGNTIESVNLRVGINDYEHSEIEPDGEVATLFKNEAFEARLEFGLCGGKACLGSAVHGTRIFSLR